jgi:predicted nucleic-acid-binding protein
MQKQTPKPVNKELLDTYSDYLISSFSYTTATGLSQMLDNQITHDKITQFLSAREYTSKDLWLLVKLKVREIETNDGCIIFDDTIEEKPYTDENDIICWHHDHSKGKDLKGINILNCIYHNNKGTIPLAFEAVRKTEIYIDPKSGKQKRKSPITKNEMLLQMFYQALKNQVKFLYVLADSWFSSKENMQEVVDNDKHFIFAIKSNRLIALSQSDKLQGEFVRVDSLNLKEGETIQCYFKGLDFPTLLTYQVFKNKDGQTGTLYLAASDITLESSEINAIYQKRWKVEEYHKSIKQNTSLAKSPTRRVTTQINHIFASIYAFFKMELLNMQTNLNHFALKTKLYTRALMLSFNELRKLQNA